MKNCEKCNSTDLTYVTEYEHLDFESEDYIRDNGWLCMDCECFHIEDGSYYEFFTGDNTKVDKVNYKQIIM